MAFELDLLELKYILLHVYIYIYSLVLLQWKAKEKL
jgi:hypothetical protein